MILRAISVVLACAVAAPLAAAERPAVPMTRPGVVTRDLPAVTPNIVRPAPAFRVAPSDLPRANLVRPENVRPLLPTDARPIMPMLPGRPTLPILRPAPGVRPIDMVRPLPAPIARPVRPSN